jgi:hypothetical protein
MHLAKRRVESPKPIRHRITAATGLVRWLLYTRQQVSLSA